MNEYIDILLTGTYALLTFMFMVGMGSLPFYGIAVFLDKNRDLANNGFIIVGSILTGIGWLLMWLYCCYYIIKTVAITAGWIS